jgi:natural product precursor
MEQKKVLRKLTLNKEEIVNLNDFEMRNLRGGTDSVAICAVTAIVSAVSAVASAVGVGYTIGKDNSNWNCDHTKEANCMGDTSKAFIAGYCALPDAYVYSIGH